MLETMTTSSPSLNDSSCDPVCGMSVSRSSAEHQAQFNGNPVYFCSDHCREKFAIDPYLYLSGRHKELALNASADTRYTCAMDPEVIQDGPGDCPVCGMALEPMAVEADADNPELKDYTRRLWVGLLLAIPLVVLSMGPMVGLPVRGLFGERNAVLIELLLATPVVFWVARPFFQRGIRSLRTLKFNMWTLIMFGVGAAYSYSVVATFSPDSFPELIKHNGHVPVYFEASVVIVVLVLLGQVLELKARERTGDAIRSLLDLAPKFARGINPDNTEYDVPLNHLLAGDRIRLKPGESVPVDGVVESGSTAIDESMITGEPMPVSKSSGSAVTGGTLNGNGSVIITAAKVGNETVLARIIELVATAQRSKPPIQNMADKVAAWFVPLVILVSVIAFVMWMRFGPEPQLIYALVASISVLVIACPCALGLATPMSIVNAMGRGARDGVLIRDATSLEQMARVDTLIVDKTGTLTEGKPQLSDCLAFDNYSQDNLLASAAALESSSEHPLARSVVSAANAQSLSIPPAVDFNSVTGKGVSGTVNNQKMALGNAALMQDRGVTIDHVADTVQRLQKDGKTVIYIADNVQLAGVIAVTDKVKTGTEQALKQLKTAGLNIILATGDNPTTAKRIASALDITEVHADLSPEQKNQLVERLQKDGHRVAMAGDGVNDAPALASADVGIAMDNGSDVALESAGITLLNGDLNGIVKARTLAQATLKNIRQNLFFAFAYNAAGVPIAAGILYPFIGSLMSPMLAAAAMSLSSVSVISNSLRLRNIEL